MMKKVMFLLPVSTPNTIAPREGESEGVREGERGGEREEERERGREVHGESAMDLGDSPRGREGEEWASRAGRGARERERIWGEGERARERERV
jgi:hypothetical protein